MQGFFKGKTCTFECDRHVWSPCFHKGLGILQECKFRVMTIVYRFPWDARVRFIDFIFVQGHENASMLFAQLTNYIKLIRDNYMPFIRSGKQLWRCSSEANSNIKHKEVNIDLVLTHNSFTDFVCGSKNDHKLKYWGNMLYFKRHVQLNVYRMLMCSIKTWPRVLEGQTVITANLELSVLL